MNGPAAIGAMRHLVSFESPDDVMDGSGATIRAYGHHSEVWCQIKPVRRFSRFEGGRDLGVVSHAITFRSIPAFTADWRLRLGERVFAVLSFDDGGEARGFTRALCEETTP